jgi:hypothetical protein
VFLSSTRPHLFWGNVRIKKQRIIAEESGIDEVIELEDTPILQRKTFSDLPSGEWRMMGEVKLVIEEV